MLWQIASCVALRPSVMCVWPSQSFLDGRNVFTVKPVFISCMYGCSCARIFILSAWSNLCHVKMNPLNAELNPIRHLLALVGARHIAHVSRIRVKYLIVCFSLLLSYISWFCVITLLLPGSSRSSDDISSNASIRLLNARSASSYLALCYKLTSHSFFKHFVCYGRAAVIRNSLCDFRWYSFVCIYQHVWAHHSRSRERERSCYGGFCKACISFIHTFSLYVLKLFRSLGKICNLIYHRWKIFLGPEECSKIFLLLWRLQLAETCNWRRKMLCWEAPAT